MKIENITYNELDYNLKKALDDIEFNVNHDNEFDIIEYIEAIQRDTKKSLKENNNVLIDFDIFEKREGDYLETIVINGTDFINSLTKIYLDYDLLDNHTQLLNDIGSLLSKGEEVYLSLGETVSICEYAHDIREHFLNHGIYELDRTDCTLLNDGTDYILTIGEQEFIINTIYFNISFNLSDLSISKMDNI